jgi:hypothetical protein
MSLTHIKIWVYGAKLKCTCETLAAQAQNMQKVIFELVDEKAHKHASNQIRGQQLLSLSIKTGRMQG